MSSFFFCRCSQSLIPSVELCNSFAAANIYHHIEPRDTVSGTEGCIIESGPENFEMESPIEAGPSRIATKSPNYNVDKCCVLLKNVVAAPGGVECGICGGELTTPVVQFDCSAKHCYCIDCFRQFAQTELIDRRFKLHASLGYTVGCPSGCDDSWIADPHQFYLLGKDMYSKYKCMATEAVLVEVGGNYCPNPLCGVAFTFESDSPGIDTLLCPDCKIAVCILCRMRKSHCICAVSETTSSPSQLSPELDGEFQSVRLVRSNSKPCPKCRSPTEKTGGCNHMSCVQCGCQWCWLCVKEWTDDCQFSHWLESR